MKEDPKGSYFEGTLDDGLGLWVCCERSDLEVNGRLYFRLEFEMKEHMPIQLTENLRKCLAIQPGCQDMKAVPWCCHQEPEYISRETGITIGDVVDAARRIYAAHEDCPLMVGSTWTRRLRSTRYPISHGQVRLP